MLEGGGASRTKLYIVLITGFPVCSQDVMQVEGFLSNSVTLSQKQEFTKAVLR